MPAVLVTHDVFVLSGHLVGYDEGLTEPLYRRKYAEYMDPRTSQTGGA